MPAPKKANKHKAKAAAKAKAKAKAAATKSSTTNNSKGKSKAVVPTPLHIEDISAPRLDDDGDDASSEEFYPLHRTTVRFDDGDTDKVMSSGVHVKIEDAPIHSGRSSRAVSPYDHLHHVEVDPHAHSRDGETGRGRSRRPRLLWCSVVDRETLEVLDCHHERYYGERVPRLGGPSSEDGKKWSDRLDRSGL
ncbi:hypothetical protein MNV49_000509 [Pseudohyphozyma bogoriensis]|nr:hypothetical protein MNV49_000509 [Pseudohyphozyma bogoriensis]